MGSRKCLQVHKGSALHHGIRGIARAWICFAPNVASVLRAVPAGLQNAMFVDIARRIWLERRWRA